MTITFIVFSTTNTVILIMTLTITMTITITVLLPGVTLLFFNSQLSEVVTRIADCLQTLIRQGVRGQAEGGQTLEASTTEMLDKVVGHDVDCIDGEGLQFLELGKVLEAHVPQG